MDLLNNLVSRQPAMPYQFCLRGHAFVLVIFLGELVDRMRELDGAVTRNYCQLYHRIRRDAKGDALPEATAGIVTRRTVGAVCQSCRGCDYLSIEVLPLRTEGL